MSSPVPPPPPGRAGAGLHHVAYACRDADATVRFYEDVMGFPLVYTETTAAEDGFFRHLFFDTGDGSCIAFFDLHGAGETDDWSPAVTGSNGQPIWVSHVAFAATGEDQAAFSARAADAGVDTFEIDHGWCHSIYAIDPNGIMVEFCADTPGFLVDRSTAYERRGATTVDGAPPMAREG